MAMYDPNTQYVLKGTNVNHIPRSIPSFDCPSFTMLDSLAVDELSEPRIFDLSDFYLAFQSRDPFPSQEHISRIGPYWERTKHLDVSSASHLTFIHDSEEANSWKLEADVLLAWEQVEKDVENAISTLQQPAFSNLEVDEPVPTPILLCAHQYGYKDGHPSEDEAQKAAWTSRRVILASMAYLSFLVRACQLFSTTTEWRLRLTESTSAQFVQWVESSTVISDNTPGTRVGCFWHPRGRSRWHNLVMTVFIDTGVPIWVHYGPKQETFEEQVHGREVVDARVVLTQDEFATLGAEMAQGGHVGPVDSVRQHRYNEISGQWSGETWKTFFERRKARNAAIEKNESPEERHARLQRKEANDPDPPRRQRPTKNSKVFVWTEIEHSWSQGTSEKPTSRVRTLVTKADVETHFVHRKGQRRYDSFANEWDICSEFGSDSERLDSGAEDYDEDEDDFPRRFYPRKLDDDQGISNSLQEEDVADA